MRGLGVSKGEAMELMERMVPVVQLGSVLGFSASDTFYERPFVGDNASGAVAAQLAKCQIFNPLLSGVDVIVEKAYIRVDPIADVDLRVHNVALTDEVQTKAFRDRRIRGLPAVTLRDVTAAGDVGDEVALFRVAAASELFLLDFLIQPGQGIHFTCRTVNQGLNVTWYGTEQNRE